MHFYYPDLGVDPAAPLVPPQAGIIIRKRPCALVAAPPLLRTFNLRCGITPDLERPSKRYGSIPTDGPAKGQMLAPTGRICWASGTRRGL